MIPLDDYFATPTEQSLLVNQMATIIRSTGDDPPELGLVLDVRHDETGHAWRQEVRFTRLSMIELTQLMVYSCSQVGIDWSQDEDSNEE